MVIAKGHGDARICFLFELKTLANKGEVHCFSSLCNKGAKNAK